MNDELDDGLDEYLEERMADPKFAAAYRRAVLRHVERIGGSCLIYEGAILALRRIPWAPQPPAVSDLVWKIRSKTLRFWVGSAVCGYLLWHFLEGDTVALPRPSL